MQKPVTYWLMLCLCISSLASYAHPAAPTAALGGRGLLRHPTAASLTATPGALAAFATTVGTASAQQGAYVGGTDLTGAVTATAPAGFEVSWTAGANFGASQVLTQLGGTFTNVPLYIRLTGTALGTYSGNVTLASPGAPTQVVAVTGTVTTVVNPNPVATVTSVAPSTGNAGVATTLDFYGTNFVPGVVVAIAPILNSNAYFSVGPTTFISSTHVTALVRSSASTGTIRGSVSATNPVPGGGGNTPDGSVVYTVQASPPVITSFSPTSGPVGTPVTIKGYNLFVSGGGVTYNSTVSFNGTPIFTTPGETQIMTVVPVGATTGFITVTNPNGGAVSAVPFTVITPRTGFYEDFEQGTKTAYAPASVQLRSGGWTFRESLIGTTAGADKFNDTRSARLRGGGVLEMDTDKPNGAGVVTVSAATYATEADVSFIPEISTDGGVTYSSLLASGATPPVLTGILTPYTFTANRGGSVRLRFSSTNAAATTSPRLNLDDIGITDYTVLATTRPAQLPSLHLFPNPAREQVIVAGTGSTGAQVMLLDLLGRPVQPPATVADGCPLPLPATLPAGLYLVRVQTATGQRTERLVKE